MIDGLNAEEQCVHLRSIRIRKYLVNLSLYIIGMIYLQSQFFVPRSLQLKNLASTTLE